MNKNKQEKKIEKIEGKRIEREGNISYYVKWFGYNENYNSWELYQNLSSIRVLIDKYETELNEQYKKGIINLNEYPITNIKKEQNSFFIGRKRNENYDELIESSNNKNESNEEEYLDLSKSPERLTNIYEENNKLMLKVKWKGVEKESEESYKTIRDLYPNTLISFLENHINIDGKKINFNTKSNEYNLI
jgi:hypothetical protein